MLLLNLTSNFKISFEINKFLIHTLLFCLRTRLIRRYAGFPTLRCNFKRQHPSLEKLRCYFLFLLHQTHPRSNVRLFKQGAICSCPVGFDVKFCKDTKDVLKLWLPIPPPCFRYFTIQRIGTNLTKTDIVHHPVLSFPTYHVCLLCSNSTTHALSVM